MTYDDWKTRDDTPEPERDGWCDECEHYECDCPCCTEPQEITLACQDCGRVVLTSALWPATRDPQSAAVCWDCGPGSKAK